MDRGSEKTVHTVNHHPGRLHRTAGPEVVVISTSSESTETALRKAGVLADQLQSRVLVLLARVVPYPMSILSPPVALSFEEQRIRKMAVQCPLQTRVLICLCRDEWDPLSTALKPDSIVILGRKKRWWRTRELRLARRLRSAGHFVIMAEEE